MKTIIRNNNIRREDDDKADRLVRNEGYVYTPKKNWKTNVRDIDKKPEKKSK